MADDKRLAFEALKKAQNTCKDALIVLSDTSQESPNDLTILHKDLLSFLKLIRTSTTKLALALKPASPTYKASLTPSKDISDQVAGLTHCIRLFHPNFGSTLRQEIVTTGDDITQAILYFLQGFLNEDASDGYLARVGTIHDLIDKACVHLSKTNLMAVQKKWIQNQESLEDGMNEIEEILQGGGEENADDGWDELGLGDDKITPEEIERTKKTQTALRLTVVLHRRINTDILSSKTGSCAVDSLDSLLKLSNDLAEGSDNIISALHPKQLQEEIEDELEKHTATLRSIRIKVLDLLSDPTLESSMESMKLDAPISSKKTGAEWFVACFQQIEKALERLRSSPGVS